MGDTFSTASTRHRRQHRRKINGMILAADKILTLVDNNTKIVPGHGAPMFSYQGKTHLTFCVLQEQ